METTKDIMSKRDDAIKSMKQANYDPYTIFINLQALGLDTKEDANDVISYLKEKDREVREFTKTSLRKFKKRTIR